MHCILSPGRQLSYQCLQLSQNTSAKPQPGASSKEWSPLKMGQRSLSAEQISGGHFRSLCQDCESLSLSGFPWLVMGSLKLRIVMYLEAHRSCVCIIQAHIDPILSSLHVFLGPEHIHVKCRSRGALITLDRDTDSDHLADTEDRAIVFLFVQKSILLQTWTSVVCESEDDIMCLYTNVENSSLDLVINPLIIQY